MGGRSKSKGSSSSASGNMANAQSQVGAATQQGANDWLTGLMGNQSSMIGSTLGPLIQGGQQMMADNPGMKNFMERAGQKTQEWGQADWLQDFAETARGWAPTPPQGQPGQQTPFYKGIDEGRQADYQRFLDHQARYGR